MILAIYVVKGSLEVRAPEFRFWSVVEWLRGGR
jgi:hypothetical protein